MTTLVFAEQHRVRRLATTMVVALLLVLGGAPAVEALGRYVPVIVMSRDATSAVDLTLGARGEIDNVLPIIGGVSARVPESRMDELSARAIVVPDRTLHLQSASYGDALVSAYPQAVGAPALWSREITGRGVTVALIDTGIADVPDLRGRVVARANFTKERSLEDTYGHGTFQAGIIAGNGASSDGKYVGVAPEANLMSVKVADRSGMTSLGQVLAGIQLVDVSANRFNVGVVLLALHSESPLPPELDPLTNALRELWARGIVVVVPSGNEGPDAKTIASPGEDPVLLTAGSVDDHATGSQGDDTVSEYSGRGPTRWGDEKPDIAAPGEHLVSLRAPGSTIDEEYPSARVDDAYFRGSGTSMSSAAAAGAAALILQAKPELSPDEVKALMQATAADVSDGDPDSVGAGEVDANEAVLFDGEMPELPPVPDLGELDKPWMPRGLDAEWVRSRADGAQEWAARRWDARRWDLNDWDARQWAARQWAARQWAARQWAARRWDARRWDARRWDARRWDARRWDARRWDARRWDAGQWDARRWDARRWDADGWG